MMLLFAILMIAASVSMMRDRQQKQESEHAGKFNYALIFLEGFILGSLTGLVGAGGGFLIVPALVMLRNLPMKLAIGTSLLIIAANSLIGFTGDIFHTTMDWSFLLTITGLAVGGIFLGGLLSHKVSGTSLKKGFGGFVLVMGIFIIVRELLVLNAGH